MRSLYLMAAPSLMFHFLESFRRFATRGEIFSLKFTKYRLAAGLRPDPLGELKCSPDPLAAIRGPTSKGRGRGRGKGEGRRGKGRGGEGIPLPPPPTEDTFRRLYQCRVEIMQHYCTSRSEEIEENYIMHICQRSAIKQEDKLS